MKQNVGGLDRTARLVIGPIAAIVGIAIVAGVISSSTLLGGLLVVVGAILSVTGAVQKCPLNSLLGVDTCPRA